MWARTETGILTAIKVSAPAQRQLCTSTSSLRRVNIRLRAMKTALTSLSVALLLILSFAFAACNSKSISTKPNFIISVTVVNLAGTGGGLVLLDNSTDNLPVNMNGTFTFTETVTGGSAYSSRFLRSLQIPSRFAEWLTARESQTPTSRFKSTAAITNGNG